MTQKDPKDDRSALSKLQQELSEMHGRPFDVDKAIAEHRAKQERDRQAEREAEAKLEKEHARARERSHEIRMQKEAEATDRALTEKQQRFDDQMRKFEREKGAKAHKEKIKGAQKKDIR